MVSQEAIDAYQRLVYQLSSAQETLKGVGPGTADKVLKPKIKDIEENIKLINYNFELCKKELGLK